MTLVLVHSAPSPPPEAPAFCAVMAALPDLTDADLRRVISAAVAHAIQRMPEDIIRARRRKGAAMNRVRQPDLFARAA